MGFGFNEGFKTELEQLFWFKEKPTTLTNFWWMCGRSCSLSQLIKVKKIWVSVATCIFVYGISVYSKIEHYEKCVAGPSLICIVCILLICHREAFIKHICHRLIITTSEFILWDLEVKILYDEFNRVFNKRIFYLVDSGVNVTAQCSCSYFRYGDWNSIPILQGLSGIDFAATGFFFFIGTVKLEDFIGE